MGIVLAVIFLAIAIAALAAYGGTPHVSGTSTCGPINAFGQHFTALHADCRYVNLGEIVLAVAFFVFAVIAMLSARPGR